MSSKRTATSDLNHTNWDSVEDPEDKGEFKTATEDVLQSRIIKKARRRGAPESGESTGTSVFSGFSGFGKGASIATTVASGSPFSFLSKIPSPSSAVLPVSAEKVPAKDTPRLSKNNNYAFDQSNDYYAKLKSLNKTVSAWVKTHVDQNPLCILTPIFEDYDRYLKEIQKPAEKNSASIIKPPGKDNSTSTFTGFKFTSNTPAHISDTKASEINKSNDMPKAPGSSGNIFGSSSSSGFSFTKSEPNTSATTDSKTDDKSSTTGVFSFSSGKPFTFANVVPSTEPSKSQGDGEEESEDLPPKVEFKQVVEEDSIFSKKCKVFVKHDGNFADRGVGTLYLKPVQDQKRTQLLVRADTNLGNILLNIILNDTIPTRRMGKNNVMLVCPTPDSDKPTQVLVRVKTGEEADELLENIDKYKITSD